MRAKAGWALAAVLAMLMFPAGATAGNFTVNSLGDTPDAAANGVCADAGGACTLRAAMSEAVGGGDDQITIAVSGTINLGSLLASANGAVYTITGPGADKLTIRRNAAPAFSIFRVNGGGTLRLSGVTLTNGGGSPVGGGIAVETNSSSLSIDQVAIVGNSATAGGGIYSVGSLMIDRSTIAGNTAGSAGGIGMFSGGANSTISRSTIAGNTATGGGTSAGGVYSDGVSSTFDSSTIAGNTAGANSGANFVTVNIATTRLRNSIVADPLGPATVKNCVTAVGGTVASLGFNLDEDATCGSLGPGDLKGVDPLLSGLAVNGGPTPTMALPESSPAVDKGSSAGSTTDQRGFLRPFDLVSLPNAAGGDGCDIGAYELVKPCFNKKGKKRKRCRCKLRKKKKQRRKCLAKVKNKKK